jgi:TRAP transporter TAXI family solute receptor
MQKRNKFFWRSPLLATLPLCLSMVGAQSNISSISPVPAIAHSTPQIDAHHHQTKLVNSKPATQTISKIASKLQNPSTSATNKVVSIYTPSQSPNLSLPLQPIIPITPPTSILAQIKFRTMTASKQGGYYRAAQELDRVIDAAEIQLIVEESAGSQQNLQAIANGTADLAFIQMDAAALQEKYDFANGTEVMEQIRIFAPTTNETIHIVVNKNSGITHLRDLADKQVSFGPRASGTAVSAAYVYLALGLEPAQTSQNITFASIADSIAMVNRGELDAAFFTATKGVPLLANLSDIESQNLVLLSIDDFKPFANSSSGFSLYAPVYLPAYTYPWQEQEVAALSTFSFIIVNAAIDADQIYALAKAVYGNADSLKQQNSFWQFLSVEQARVDIAGQAPYHEGVIRYINEVYQSN